MNLNTNTQVLKPCTEEATTTWTSSCRVLWMVAVMSEEGYWYILWAIQKCLKTGYHVENLMLSDWNWCPHVQ